MTESMHLERTGQWKSDTIHFCVARQPHQKQHPNPDNGHPTSERLFIGSSDFKVYEFDVSLQAPELLALEGSGHQSYVTGLTLAGDALVSCSYDRQLIWWDVTERKQIRSVEAHDKWIRRVITTADGERIISVADDMSCRVWDAASGQHIISLTDHAPVTPHNYPSMLYAVTASPDGKWLATGDRMGHVAIWDATSLEKVGELDCPIMYTWDPTQRRHSIGGIRSLAFSPDGTKLAVGGIGTIRNIDHLGGPARLEVFQWQTGSRLYELEDEKFKGLIEQIAWSPDSRLLLTAGGDHKGFLTFYDMQSGQLNSQVSSDGHIHGFVTDDSLSTICTVGHNRIERWAVSQSEPSEGGTNRTG